MSSCPRLFAAVLLLASGAGAAAAQQAPGPQSAAQQTDVIGSLLDAPRNTRPKVADEPDTAAAALTRQPDPAVGLPNGPQPSAPASPKLDRPVLLEETGRAPDTPTPRDLAYDSRIRASFASAQSFQGPLDGAWTLSAAGEGELYAFSLSDRRGAVEGAWRDLRRSGALGASGFIDEVERTSADVVLKFTPDGAAPVTVTLTGVGSTWSGELAEGGRTRPVTLRKAPTP